VVNLRGVEGEDHRVTGSTTAISLLLETNKGTKSYLIDFRKYVLGLYRSAYMEMDFFKALIFNDRDYCT
jgi:hypothetical protein